MKIAINGFGRIGRLVLRQLVSGRYPSLEVVGINDLVPPDNLAYLFKYDSTHGIFTGTVSSEGSFLVVNGQKIAISSEKEVAKLPWKDLGVDIVIESTGRFTSLEDASQHLTAGAKKVVISAPGKGEVPTFVVGVNHTGYDPDQHSVVSNASCTTNCLAVLAKVIENSFGIEEGLMTTVHAATATQQVVDAPSKKDWRGGRGAMQNIVPATTGAAKAVTLCLPELKGKLTGMAFRVPVADVSVVDLTVRLKTATSYEKICAEVKKAAEGSLKGILAYCDEQVVSSDFIGSHYSCVFDSLAGIGLSDWFFKLIAWYDNETGYATRVVDLIEHMAKLAK